MKWSKKEPLRPINTCHNSYQIEKFMLAWKTYQWIYMPKEPLMLPKSILLTEPHVNAQQGQMQ
jgi:hypothetical protein